MDEFLNCSFVSNFLSTEQKTETEEEEEGKCDEFCLRF